MPTSLDPSPGPPGAPPDHPRPMDREARREQARRAARRRFRFLAPFALAAGLSVPYLATNDEPDRLDAAIRARSGGSYLPLGAGVTRYEVTGPADGQTVVLIHGVTLPMEVWDATAQALAGAGLRVIRYDLYGRGYSDRPAGARYDPDLYDAQLTELLDKLAPGARVDLVGMSMGGIIVSEFTRRHPERVRRLALVDPAGAGTGAPMMSKVSLLPGLGEYVMRVGGTLKLLPGRRYLLHPERFPDLDPRYRRTLRFEGTRRAVLQSLRHMPLDDAEAGYRELGKLGKPTLLVWGREDKVMPFPNSAKVREWVRASDFIAVDDAAHLPQMEHPELVGPALAAFLKR